MKLPYQVDLAECVRRKIDCSRAIQTLDIDPAELSDEDARLIADRIHGSGIYSLRVCLDLSKSDLGTELDTSQMVVAKVPGLQAVLVACRENQLSIERKISEFHSGVAEAKLRSESHKKA